VAVEDKVLDERVLVLEVVLVVEVVVVVVEPPGL